MSNTVATIAVIDDDDGVRSSLKQLLRSAEFDAVTFGSAEDYLRSLADGRVDCLIVDVNLPGMNGVALVQQLAAAGSKVPAVLITARDDPMTLELIKRAGAVPHLRKPFSDEELFAAIYSVLPT